MYADATIATYTHAWEPVNLSGCPSVAPIAAAMRMPAITPIIAKNSAVLKADLVSVRRRTRGERSVRSVLRVGFRSRTFVEVRALTTWDEALKAVGLAE